jgi:hypothetical protein
MVGRAVCKEGKWERGKRGNTEKKSKNPQKLNMSRASVDKGGALSADNELLN